MARWVRGTRYFNRFICSRITHVDPGSNKKNPNNHVKGELIFETWNDLSLTCSSSQLFRLSQCISDYRLDLLGITKTHFPGTGSELLDNGLFLIYIGRVDGIRRQGVGLYWSKRIKNSLNSHMPVSERVLTARLTTIEQQSSRPGQNTQRNYTEGVKMDERFC